MIGGRSPFSDPDRGYHSCVNILANCFHGFGHGLLRRQARIDHLVAPYTPCTMITQFSPSYEWFKSVQATLHVCKGHVRGCAQGAWHGFFNDRTEKQIDVAYSSPQFFWMYPCNIASVAPKECFHYKLIEQGPKENVEAPMPTPKAAYPNQLAAMHAYQLYNESTQLSDLCTVLTARPNRDGCFFGVASFLYPLFEAADGDVAPAQRCPKMMLEMSIFGATYYCPLLSGVVNGTPLPKRIKFPERFILATPRVFPQNPLADFCTKFARPAHVGSMSDVERADWLACFYGGMYNRVTGAYDKRAFLTRAKSVCNTTAFLSDLDGNVHGQLNASLCGSSKAAWETIWYQ